MGVGPAELLILLLFIVLPAILIGKLAGRRGENPWLFGVLALILWLHWTRFVGHLLVNAGDHAMAD